MLSLRTLLATLAVALAALVPATAASASPSSGGGGTVGAAPSTRSDGTAVVPITDADRARLGASLPTRATGWGIHPDGSINLVNKNGTDLKRNAAFWSKAWKVLKCAAAITYVIGSNVLIAGKIAKFKTFIKEVGGIKDAAKLLTGASTRAEKIEKLSELGVGAASEIFSINAIKSQC
jgi:hypothetical protein